MTRGAELNNPINLKHNPNIKWKGEEVTHDPEGVLCQFDTMVDGCRAGAIDILTAFLDHQRTTVTAIITPFAPPGVDNNETTSYIGFMSRWMGVQPLDHVDLTEPAALIKWMVGQIQFEQGSQIATTDEIAQGITEALAYKGAS